MTRKTGAAATWNPDNFPTYVVTVTLLCLAVLAAGIGSVEGLYHAGSWSEPPPLQWTLPAAVDVFLIGSALATLQLRKRRAYIAAAGVGVVTLALVTFSSVTNYSYVYTRSDHTTLEGVAGPWIKAAMPVLLLLALEIVAALTSTRNNREASPLNRAHATIKAQRKQIAEMKKTVRRPTPEVTE
jgi:peptidoglycan/LPS O-acetylase OafA/YrhL